MTMECYSKIQQEVVSYCGKTGTGLLVTVREGRTAEEEFFLGEPIDEKAPYTLRSVLTARKAARKRSVTELLFCMLRAGK